MLTTLIDAKTGRQRSFHLDCSFGCITKFIEICATPTQQIYEVAWNGNSRKYQTHAKEDAIDLFLSKKRKKYRPEFIIHTTGMHKAVA